MKRLLAIGLALILTSVLAVAQTPAKTFTIAVPQSKVQFFVGSSAGDINGNFATWTGALKMATPGHPETATLAITVTATSMSTGSGVKDNVIKGKDFFDVADYPSITFTSTKVIPSADPNKFQVQGDFTLRGVTKPVTLNVTLNRDTKGGGQITADLGFDRRDFGMTKNIPFVKVDHSVRVVMNLQVNAN